MKFIYADAALWLAAGKCLIHVTELKDRARNAAAFYARTPDTEIYRVKADVLETRAAVFEVGTIISTGIAVAVAAWAIPIIESWF